MTNETTPNGVNLPNVTPTHDDSALAFIVMQGGGVIALELYYRYAPNTVRNFIYLANDDFYNGLIFHRIISNFMIQGGCADGSGASSPEWNIKGEFPPNGFTQNTLTHERGVISMARRGPVPQIGFTEEMAFNSASTQFFIVVQDSFFLDPAGYAAFGRVISGMDVVDALRVLPTSGPPSDRPHNPPVIERIIIDTRGNDFAPPEKLPVQGS